MIEQTKLHVIQGEHAVSNDPSLMMTTVLGSCIAVCLHDSVTRVGGMNHFVLAQDPTRVAEPEEAMRYGAYAMEMLINELMKEGARKERLCAHVFGGARMMDKLGDIGAGNAAFAQHYLTCEGITQIGGSIGGRSARRVEFWPASGLVRQRKVAALEVAQESAQSSSSDGGVELF